MRHIIVVVLALSLVLGGCTPSNPTATPVQVTPSATPDPEPPKYTTYIVVKGEVLGTIAEAVDSDIAEIMSLNGLVDPDFILEGARLKVINPVYRQWAARHGVTITIPTAVP